MNKPSPFAEFNVISCENSLASTYQPQLVIDCTPSAPSTPAVVFASNGDYTDKVLVEWSSVNGASSYNVYRRTTDNSQLATCIADGVVSTSYNDTSAVTGTTYYYWVRAVNPIGMSDYSSSDSGYRQAAPTKILRIQGDLNFGQVAVGSYGDKTLTFYNDGTQTLTIQLMSASDFPNNADGFSASPAGVIVVPASSSYPVLIRFRPSAGKSYSGTWNINSDATSGTTSIAFSGNEPASPGQLNFEHTEYTVNEGSGTVTLNVLRQNGSSGAISVDCATLNVAVPNAATAGSDYVSKSVKLNWADGDSSAKSVTISIINDSAVEGDEIFGVGLSNQTGGATTGISLAGVTITDNDVSLTYPVTYNANGATSGSAPVAQTKTNNVILTIASNSGNLAKTGYTFAGWNTAANSSGTDYAAGGGYTANASVTLYAKWTVSSYTVTFDAQSGTAPSPLSKSVTYGSTYGALANTTRAGYLFGGWWTGSGGTGSEIIFSSTVAITSAQKLYAKWIPVYTLTVNNGIGGGPYASGDRVAISATVPSDKRFYRWLGATQYVDSVTSASTYVTMPAFDITLTATNRAIAMPWLNLLLD